MERKTVQIVITAFVSPLFTDDALSAELTRQRAFTKFEKVLGSDFWIEAVNARGDLSFAAEQIADGKSPLFGFSDELLRKLSDVVSAERRRRLEADFAARGVEIEY